MFSHPGFNELQKGRGMLVQGGRAAVQGRNEHDRSRYSYPAILGLLALSLLIVLGSPLPALADCEVGKRVFVAELILEDPCNDDELLLAEPSVFPVGKDPS